MNFESFGECECRFSTWNSKTTDKNKIAKRSRQLIDLLLELDGSTYFTAQKKKKEEGKTPTDLEIKHNGS